MLTIDAKEFIDASYEGDLLAAAKATLDALNRYLSMDPGRRQGAGGEIGPGPGDLARHGASDLASQHQVE